MGAGVAGINFQGNPANCRGYSPACAATPAHLAGGVLGAQPVWYSLLLAKALIGARPLSASVTSPGTPNVLVRAFMNRGLRVLIVDYDAPGSQPAAIRLRVRPGRSAATVLALTGPSPAATTGVRLGGRAVAPDGSWSGPAALPRLTGHRGVISLTVAPSSAVLVTVPGGP
jgi:hypothetical protein